MPTPNWQAATAGQTPRAAHVNQLLGLHQMQLLYTGVQQAGQTTAGTGGTAGNGLYLAQSFTTGAAQTAIGYVALDIISNTSAGASLAPTTVSICTNSGGHPGATLISATATTEYVFLGPTYIVVPTPLTSLTASTTYWIVVAAAGTSSFHYTWNKSNQASGASTSPDGVTWTAQTYGLLYQVYDQSPVGSLTATWEDGGARYVWMGRNANGTLAQIAEYTAGQTAAGYCQTFRSPAYTSGQTTKVT